MLSAGVVSPSCSVLARGRRVAGASEGVVGVSLGRWVPALVGGVVGSACIDTFELGGGGGINVSDTRLISCAPNSSPIEPELAPAWNRRDMPRTDGVRFTIDGVDVARFCCCCCCCCCWQDEISKRGRWWLEEEMC